MEDNVIITPEKTPEEIRQSIADNIINKLDTTAGKEQESDMLKEKQNFGDLAHQIEGNELLGLSTVEEKVMKYIILKHPEDKYFLNWDNIHTLGELYYQNYHSDEYRAYQHKFKLITSKYYNPKKYILEITSEQLQVYAKDTKDTKTDKEETTRKLLDKLDKPEFKNAKYIAHNGYTTILQLREKLSKQYKHLLELPYVDPVDKKKFIKLRTHFIKNINEYYTYLYYYNRINNYVMTERQITLPHLSTLYYSEIENSTTPRIDKVDIRLHPDIINQKYNNDAAKLELYLEVKRKIQEQNDNNKDKKIQTELNNIIKEYINFDKLYQSKLINYISQRKNKKIISDMVIFNGQPQPGDGSVEINNDNNDTKEISNNKTSYKTNFDDMDESERKRKFYFINKAKRERGDF